MLLLKLGFNSVALLVPAWGVMINIQNASKMCPKSIQNPSQTQHWHSRLMSSPPGLFSQCLWTSPPAAEQPSWVLNTISPEPGSFLCRPVQNESC